jgi:hypothetical protein
MPSPIYQNMVNLVVRLPIRRYPSKFMNVMMWEHHTFDSKIFRCGKVYYSNSIIIINFVSHDIHCPGQDLNWESPKCKVEALLLEPTGSQLE